MPGSFPSFLMNPVEENQLLFHCILEDRHGQNSETNLKFYIYRFFDTFNLQRDLRNALLFLQPLLTSKLIIIRTKNIV
jgi:hypothetical protein